MSNITEPYWPDELKARTGRSIQNQGELLAWESDLQHEFGCIVGMAQEIIDSIRYAFAAGTDRYETNRRKSAFDYTSVDLMRWIQVFRRHKQFGNQRIITTKKSQRTIAQLRDAIAKTENPDEIWELICDAPTDDSCFDLEQYAVSKHGFDAKPHKRAAEKITAMAIEIAMKFDAGSNHGMRERYIRNKYAEYYK